MLAIQNPHPTPDKCVTNLLPCRIRYDGPTKVTKRFWAPVTGKDGTKTSHFRGRRLRGRVVQIPTNYQGLILKSTDRVLPVSISSSTTTTTTTTTTLTQDISSSLLRRSGFESDMYDDDDDDDDGDQNEHLQHDDYEEKEEGERISEPVKVLEQVSTFDEMVVWGHDEVPGSDDGFVRGVEEWIGFAAAIHGSSPSSSTDVDDNSNNDRN